MKTTTSTQALLRLLILLICLVASFTSSYAQDPDPEEVQTIYIHSRGLQRVGNTFESIWLIDNQTVMVPMKKTFEFDILHRFGTIQNGYSDFLGLYAPSNIRIGFGYTPIDNVMIGLGFTKDRLLWDFNFKYALLKERSGAPISVTYFGNMGVDTREITLFNHESDRLSFFHQIMFARKLTRDLSVQASASISHFNVVDGIQTGENEVEKKMNNDHIGVSFLGRYKVSDAFAFIGNMDFPITKHPTNNPQPNISFGVELATPLHAFQVFLGNYRWMVPQYNNILNQNDFRDGAFLIGFNITRLLDLQEEDLLDMMFKRKGKKKEEAGH